MSGISPAVRFRTAKVEDLEDVMALEDLGFLPGIRERPEVFRERILHFPNGFLLMDIDGDSMPAGYLCSEIWPWIPTPTREAFTLNHSIASQHDPGAGDLYIASMTVRPDLRGSGLGERLFLEVFERLLPGYPSVHSSILMVSEAWVHARRIYVHHGFQEVLRLDGFFTPTGRPKETAIVMRKRLVDGPPATIGAE